MISFGKNIQKRRINLGLDKTKKKSFKTSIILIIIILYKDIYI